MSIEIKQKIKEVADDFGMPAKNLIEIVGKFYDKPKSSSQNLTEEQLNVIFDYITAQNQIGSIAEVFAAAKPKDEPKPAAPAPAPQQSQPVQSQQPAPRPQQNQPRPQGSFNNNNNRPAQQQNQRPQFNQRPQPQNQQPRPQQSQPQQQAPQSQNAQNNAQQPAKQPQPERKRERRVIDTSAVTVNADRYDDRVDSLVSERVQNYSSGKQKIGNKNKKQQAKKFGTKNRSEEQEKMRRLQLEIAKKAPLVVKIPDEITVGELASRMKKTAAEVIKCLLKNGVMASVNQTIDYDTAEFVAVELGCKVEREVVVTIEEKLFDDHEDTADELVSRPPVIVVMGHVDHGKTSLLDYIRHAKVAAGEAGGITQHIGAYTVKVGDQPITFLDTPGHAAFTEMRARGAMCTDIAILVVAADDGIMPQTIEAINHAKAANIPIIVAVNKMDKHGANPDRILTQLTEHGLTPADWGGETEVCKISAKTGEGIDDLLETARALGFRVALTTNGTLLPARQALLLAAPALYKINISLHSFEANVAGSFDDYLSGCFTFAKLAAETGKLVDLRLWNLDGETTRGQHTQNDAILAALEAVFPQPWTRNTWGLRLCERVFVHYAEKFDWPDLSVSEQRDTGTCRALKDQLAVLSDGTVVPCCLDHEGDVPLGNLFSQELDEILRALPAQALLSGFAARKLTQPLCRRCGYARRFR